MITDKILKNLEYDKILLEVAKFAKLSGGVENVLETLPEKDYESCLFQLEYTKEAYRIQFEKYQKPITSVQDVKEPLARARVLSVLEIADIIAVGKLLLASSEFALSVESCGEGFPIFQNVARGLYQNISLQKKIEEIFISDSEIADHATPTLQSLRNKKIKLKADIRSILQSFVSDKEKSKYLQDKIVTIRKDRFVVPVKVENKSAVAGLVQDYSQTGSTVFVEPMEVVEKNNELCEVEILERLEIEKILLEFTTKISQICTELLSTQRLLDGADAVLAKAGYSASTRSVMPVVNNKGIINIRGGRHPIIDKTKVVPVSVEFGKDQRYILISGPNTGGKTVTMKMVGLFSLLAMSGLFIPALEGSEVSHFENIFSDIGDAQSIENDLSTFSSHIVTLKEILDGAYDRSLVLIDELGGGTDPEEGAALALAVLEELLSRGTFGILTTHYGKLKEFSMAREDIANASMEFDESTYSPTYKLIKGSPGNSKALEIAENLGVDKYIVENAKSYVSEEKRDFDAIISKARAEMQEAESLKAEALKIKQALEEERLQNQKLKESLQSEREKITSRAKQEARQILNGATEEAGELIAEIKKISTRSDITQKEVIEAGKLKNKLKNRVVEEVEEFDENDFDAFDMNRAAIGNFVYVKTLQSVGKITKINTKKKELVVLVGMVEVSCKVSNLLRPKREMKPAEVPVPKKHTYMHNPVAKSQYKSQVELNIIGKRVHEGISELAQFLDYAVRQKTDKVRIIHGMGTGRLKEGVWEELKKNKHVKEYKLAEYNEGGAGATVVILK